MESMHYLYEPFTQYFRKACHPWHNRGPHNVGCCSASGWLMLCLFSTLAFLLFSAQFLLSLKITFTHQITSPLDFLIYVYIYICRLPISTWHLTHFPAALRLFHVPVTVSFHTLSPWRLKVCDFYVSVRTFQQHRRAKKMWVLWVFL